MRILILVGAFLISLSLVATAFKEGPYPNVTGGFGEPTCRTCHLDNPLNAPGGKLDVEGVPPSYATGQAYRITITLSRDGLERAGFEIAARFTAGKQKGKQAGVWRPLDNRVQLIPGAVDRALSFVQHNLAGSRTATPGTNRWTIEWNAPSNGGPVQFNVAGNASNNDDSPLGDFIYTRSIRSVPGGSTATRSSSPPPRPWPAEPAREP